MTRLHDTRRCRKVPSTYEHKRGVNDEIEGQFEKEPSEKLRQKRYRLLMIRLKKHVNEVD
ncbi:hypothetical protein L917_02529 [Phytophthora nicotianae]|uniref:Uncharacterized protein n=1 Tax=Phytophthora nicotianae TaxID=4792 RepID=W2LTT3_PHYNI|nr:hypothetical protein L917_02529 [Phytophthora nicotianae]